MTTLADIIQETKSELLTGQREERNKLNGAITDTATTLTVTYPLKSIARGSKLSIDLEDIYVWDASSLTVSPVDRGQFGSTAAAHTSGTIIEVNSKFSAWEVYKAVRNELAALSSPESGLYYVSTQTLVYNPVIDGYDIPTTDLLDVYEVRYSIPGPSLEWPLSTNWEMSRNMTGADSLTGTTLFVRDAFPNREIIIKAKYKFAALPASLGTSIEATGIPATAIDILSIGAAWRLTLPREVKRNFTESQGDVRRATEVPPGAELGGSRELGRLRQQRINEEASRLNQAYPSRLVRHPLRTR